MQKDWIDRMSDENKALKTTIASLTAERDEALSMIRIAYDAGYHQAECGLPNHGDIDRAATEALNKRIGAAEAAAYERAAQHCFDKAAQKLIRSLATEAETNALAEMLDAETRACADLMKQWWDDNFAEDEPHERLLARINQRNGEKP